MAKRYQLHAVADPNTTLFANDVLSVTSDKAGNVMFQTDWAVRTWLDDTDTKSQLFVVMNPEQEWPKQHNCNIQNMVIRDRLRVLELQLPRNRAYVITTGNEVNDG